jgi:hypothetical protein
MSEQPSLWIFPILIHDLHRVFANVPGRTVERVDLRFRENTGTSCGVEPGAPQNLICHKVPNARKTLLHQEQRFQRRAFSAVTKFRD